MALALFSMLNIAYIYNLLPPIYFWHKLEDINRKIKVRTKVHLSIKIYEVKIIIF